MLKPLRKINISDTAVAPDLSELIGKIGAGDSAAMAHLYDATVDRVYARVLRLTGNTADAEDITIDVYHQLWRSARQFDCAPGAPLQWLMVIARTRALDCCRKRLVRQQASYMAANLENSESRGSIEDMLYQYEAKNILSVPLSQLNSVQSRLIGLAFFDGLSHREIAQCTRMPLGTVKSQLCRALLALRMAMRAATPVHAESEAREADRDTGVDELDAAEY
jgi:RNA polymerase sigma factor (sigma-70 family)